MTKTLGMDHHVLRVALDRRTTVQLNRISQRRGLTMERLVLDTIHAIVARSLTTATAAELIGEPRFRLVNGE